MINFYLYLKRALLLVMAMALFTDMYAQERTVSGKITEEGNVPVPGVNVLVKGTTRGTVTDIEGNYRISVDEDATLVFSAIGYVTEEVAVGTQSTLNISMTQDIKALSEVIVTGYQTQERREITGAVSTVKAEDLVAIPAGNAEQQLQGRVAGVNVISSGQPGTQSLVRIRGFGSFGNNQPLYVVDGVQIESIDWLNSNDIESTTVLKDAAAASIYGVRAASGVIIITTKKGTPGKMKVTYDASYGTQVPGKGYDHLNPSEIASVTRMALENAGKDVEHAQYGDATNWGIPDYVLVGNRGGVSEGDPDINFDRYNVNYDLGDIYQIVRANKEGTDWYKELTNPAPIQNHTLGLSGGSDNVNYYVSFGYFNQQGIVQNTYNKRYSLRANTQVKVNDRIRIGENFQVAYYQSPGMPGGGQLNGNLNEGNPLAMAFRMNPIIPVRDERGNWAGTRAPGTNNPQNPIAMMDRAAGNLNRNTAIVGNVFAEVDLIEGLTARTSFNGYLFSGYSNSFSSRPYENSENPGSNNIAESSRMGQGWVWTNTASYKRTFAALHSVTALVGVEAIHDGVFRAVGGNRIELFSDDPDYRVLNNGNPIGQNNFSANEPGIKWFSKFGKIDYGFDERFILSFVVRHDGSSRFGEENRYGVFPAFSAAWNMARENFMQNVTWVNDFKLRGGWGMMGNSNIEQNLANTYGANPNFVSYDIRGTNSNLVEGFDQRRIGNPFTQWEKNETGNIGFDATLFNNSFEIIFDVYNKKTKGLLFDPELPATLGQIDWPFVNIGEMVNKGLEVQLIKKGKLGGNFRYEADLNFSTYRNEIVKVADGVTNFAGPALGSNRIGTFTRNEVGHPMSSFFGYQVAGIWQSEAEVSAADESARAATGDADASFQNGAGMGRFRYADSNGDGVISPDDRVHFGNPHADYTVGLNLKLGYGNFDLEMFFHAVQGRELINYTRWFTDFYQSFPGQALSRRILEESFHPVNNPGGTTPMPEDVANFSTNEVPNSYYMEDGSFIRARNVQLGYTIPTQLLGRTGIQKLKFFVQATNLFTLTKYTGLDPDVAGVDQTFGVDYGNYPVVRNYLVGLNLAF